MKLEVGKTYLISPPNCDDENGYVYYRFIVLWHDDIFVLYGNKGCWPNLYKKENISIKEITNEARSR